MGGSSPTPLTERQFMYSYRPEGGERERQCSRTSGPAPLDPAGTGSEWWKAVKLSLHYRTAWLLADHIYDLVTPFNSNLTERAIL